MKITYNTDKNYPELKEQIFFIDEYGDNFNNIQDLRDSIKSTDIYLISEMLGNFSFFKAFVGRYCDLEDYLLNDRKEDLDGGYIHSNFEPYNISSLNKYLKSFN